MERLVRYAGELPGLAPDLAASMNTPEVSQVAYCTAMEGGTGIASLETSWRMLYRQCERPSPFAAWEWIAAWWRNFQGINPDEPLLLFPIAVYDARDTMIGLAPFYSSGSTNGSLQRRSLRLLGDLGSTPALSEELPLLLRRGFEAEALEAMLEYLTGPARHQWDTLHLTSPVAPGISVDILSHSLTAGMRAFTTSASLDSEWLILPNSWETLRSSFSKSTRDNLAYYPRLLDRHNRSWNVKRVTQSDEISAASDMLVELHRRRAQCKVCVPHLDHIPHDVHQSCLRDAFPSMADIGKASIWQLHIDGEIAASQAVLEDETDICIYYSGFEPAFRAYSPLTILHAEIIKTAISEGKSAVNFLGGAFYYKSRWGARSVARFVQIRKVRSSPISLLRTALHFASRK